MDCHFRSISQNFKNIQNAKREDQKYINPRQRQFGRDIKNILNFQSNCFNEKFSNIQTMEIEDDFTQQYNKNFLKNDQFFVDQVAKTPISLYARNIVNYLIENEAPFSTDCNYISKIQKDITEKMRAILMDWLIDVHLKFKLQPETLYLTTNLIDRYLSSQSVSRQSLQLVGVSAMFIACKYEEIYPPHIKDFVYVCDSAYTKEQILQMESYLILQINFQLTYSSPRRFLDRFNQLINNSDIMALQMASYFVEICILDIKLLKYGASMMAAAALYLANGCLKKVEKWNSDLELQTGYKVDKLENVVSDIKKCVEKSVTSNLSDKNSLTAVHRKFSNKQFQEVAKIVGYKDIKTE